jgi:peptide/nickel transport system permease protein
MRIYIFRRLLLTIPTVFFVTLIIFLTIRFIPGSVIDLMLAQYGSPAGITKIDRQSLEHKLGLDVPIYIQYGRWVDNTILRGDLGKSLWENTPVIDEIKARWPVTLELGILALLVTQLIAFPIGIYSALRQDSWGDYFTRSFAILCIAIPTFWLGILVIVYPAIWWGYSPPITLIQFTVNPICNLRMFIVPAVVLGVSGAGGNMRIIRTMMLEVLRQDYIRTAWAKGLRERVVVMRHALKNALIPVVTMIGYQLPVLVGGAVIVENIFSLPGLGRLLTNAVTERDYPVVSGCILIIAIVLVLINLLVDLSYGFLDPRVHYK